LLPVLSDNKFTSFDQGPAFSEPKSYSAKNYQRYGTDVIILGEDTEPELKKKPNQ
jgi:hypothetical protein